MSSPSVVLVTGASSGIGRATVLEAARAGDHVVLVARGKAALEDAAEECREAGAASVIRLSCKVVLRRELPAPLVPWNLL